MKPAFKKALFGVVLFVSTFNYLISSSYGMQNEDDTEKERKNIILKPILSAPITSLSAIERKIRIKKETEFNKLSQNKIISLLHNPNALTTQDVDQMVAIAQSGSFENLYYMGQLVAQATEFQKTIFQKNESERFALEKANAFYWWCRAQNQDEPETWCQLGRLYAAGQGVERDEKEAIKWYKKAASRNNAEAQYNIGRSYYYGQGVKQDSAEAMKWHLKAAENGYAVAQCYIGNLYFRGEEVKKDDSKALEWYLKAAEQNDIEAQFMVGKLYEASKEIVRNPEEAVKWFNKSVTQDIKYAVKVGDYYYEVLQDFVKALEYYLKGAEQGNVEVQIKAGLLYEAGINGIKRNSEEAVKWFNKAFAQDVSYAKKIGKIYYRGKRNSGYAGEFRTSVKQDFAKALEWYLKAAEQNDEHSQFRIGVLYEAGIKGVKKDSAEAFKWFTKTVTQDPTYASVIGRMYCGGDPCDLEGIVCSLEDYNYNRDTVVEQDFDKALEWFHKDPDVTNTEAKYHFFSGIRCKNDKLLGGDDQAMQYFLKAAIKNHSGAQYYIGEYYEKKGNNGKAKEWYQKAAYQGYDAAKKKLLSY